MSTLNNKRKKVTGGAKELSINKKKKLPTKPKPVEDEEDDIDRMIAEQEAAGMEEEQNGEGLGISLADLAASDSEEEGEAPTENKYYKHVDEDPLFADDEELNAYIESKKRGLLRPSINDRKALQAKLLSITDNAPWPETLAISAEDDLECDDVQDDLAREGAFYKQAIWAAELGLNLCDDFGMKHIRPNDYYAEMLKTDGHMHKVRQQIALDKKKVEIKEQRRAQRDALKYGKLIEKQKKKDKEDEKKKQKRITQALKQKYSRNNKDGDEFDMELEDEENGGERQQGDKPKGLQGLRGKSFKRKAKDARFGAGGKKKGKKYNTKESFLGLERLGAARKTLHNARRQGRPGKAKRAQAKSKARH